jgi:hypothetical protein
MWKSPLEDAYYEKFFSPGRGTKKRCRVPRGGERKVRVVRKGGPKRLGKRL